MGTLQLLILLAAYLVQIGDSNAIYPDSNLCKDCSARSVSRDQECSLEDATNYQPCLCDVNCAMYGDCCPSTHYSCLDSDEGGEESVSFHCQNILIGSRDGGRIPPQGEHYWMVSICSSEWLEEMGNSKDVQEIVKNCTHHLDRSIRLPPVTDLESGLVYRNEYCALCNGVNNGIFWDYGFKCDPQLKDLLNNSNYTLHEEDFNQFCIINTFVEPSSLPPSIPPARQCYPQIDSCLELDTLNGIMMTPWNSSYYHSVVNLCREGHFQNHVVLMGQLNSIPYRNEYCALCNGVDITDVGCFFGPPDNEPSVGIGITPFNIVLDIFGNGRVATVSFMTVSSIDVFCSEAAEVYDPVIEQCRPIVSRIPFLYDSALDAGENSTNCSGELIALTDPTAFEFVSTDVLVYNEELYIVEFNTSNGTPVVCVNFSTNGTIVSTINFLTFTYPAEYLILTYIGCPLSVIGCILILLTYSLFKELRTLPSQILMHLAVAILIGNLLILVGGPVGETFERVRIICTPVAILTHYIFLSQFGWMTFTSTEIARNLYHAFKMKARESKAYKIKLFVAYTLLGWSGPLLIVIPTVIVNFTTTNLVLYGELEDGTPGRCWMNHPASVFVTFVTPLGITLIYNTVIFVVATIYLCVSSKSHSKLNSDKKVPFLRLNVAIFSVSGITWIFGFLALLPQLEWAWIPYIILNSTQGFVIFVAFLCTKRVALLYLGLLTRHRFRKGVSESSTKETVSSAKRSKQSSEEHLA